MKKIVYIGKSAAGRTIPTPGASIHCPKGVAVEVPVEIADQLLQSPDWATEEPKAAPSAKLTKEK